MIQEIPSQFCKIVDASSGELVGFGVLPTINSFASRMFFTDLENDAIFRRETITIDGDKLEIGGHESSIVNTSLTPEEASALATLFDLGANIKARQLPRPPNFGDGNCGIQFISSQYATGESPLNFLAFGAKGNQ